MRAELGRRALGAFIAAAIGAIALGLLASEDAIACSCAPISMKKAFKRSAANAQ